MANLKINAAKVEEARSSAKKIEQSLAETHARCEKLISYASSCSWKGKTKQAFLSYLEIIEKYHADVKKKYKKQSKALKNLEKNIADFEDENICREVKNI